MTSVCSTITFKGCDAESSLSVCGDVLRGRAKLVYEGHRVKVTGTKKRENAYSRSVKLGAVTSEL